MVLEASRLEESQLHQSQMNRTINPDAE